MGNDFQFRDETGKFTDVGRAVEELNRKRPPIHVEGGLACEVALKPPAESGTATPVVPGQTGSIHQVEIDRRDAGAGAPEKAE